MELVEEQSFRLQTLPILVLLVDRVVEDTRLVLDNLALLVRETLVVLAFLVVVEVVEALALLVPLQVEEAVAMVAME